MTLHCTLVSASRSGPVTAPLELTIDAPRGSAGAELHQQLVRMFGTGRVTVCGTELQSLQVGEPPLVNGAVLVDVGDSVPRPRTHRNGARGGNETGLALAVHSGSAAGTVVSLARGTYTIGRRGTRIVIPDPDMSRQHARLTVTDTGIFIEDLDSSNGTWVDGQRVRNTPVSTASDIHCGSSTLSLVFTDNAPVVPLEAGSAVDEPIVVAARADTGNRAVLVLTAVLPLAIGIGLALWTGMWMFLAFAGASAVSVLIPVLTSRRQRRDTAAAVAAAARQDSERRRRAGPSVSTLALGALRPFSHDLSEVADGRIWLRIGLGEQPANIRFEPAGATHDIPSAGKVPVLLDPSPGETVFRGSRTMAGGLVRAVVMQLGAYPKAAKTRVVIHGAPEFLPLASRFLPRVNLTATTEDCRILLRETPLPGSHGVLILPCSGGDIEPGTELANEAVRLGWQVLRFVAPGDAPLDGGIELSEPQSIMWRPGGTTHFVPDLAPVDVFDAFCRGLASETDVQIADRQIPDTCALGDILALTAAGTRARWKAAASRRGLPVPLGRSTAGVRSWDLDADGPHLLVAGTTGSGKSELLRTLVAALALSHPPDSVNFLFVDFKGGSGLGPLAGLVHCVGLLTDLSTDGLERTLISLRAEIRRREQAFAEANVPDLAAYKSTPSGAETPIPHLVIVIDEFRMLVDDAPDVLRELMRIASIGRSLGIHLVMATQRPQGALTADIRANVTSSIALRVQSDMESVDIIGSKVAAAIGVEQPGRAYIARGAQPPQEFQAASLGRPSHESPQDQCVSVRLTAEYLTRVREVTGAGELQTPAQAALPLISLVEELWTARGGHPPRRPVAPPLPLDLRVPIASGPGAGSASSDGAEQRWSIELGAVDLPHAQQISPLSWEPARHSHLAFIGSAASGAGDALDLTVRRVLAHPQEAHCYILDAAGTLHHAAGHQRTGAHAGLHELRHAARILERLVQELASRLGRRSPAAVPLVLVLSGWGSWVSAFRSGPLAWAEDLVHDLVRDGQRAGIAVAMTGERELANSRFSGSIPNRLYFPAGSNEDSRLAWPKMPSAAPVKCRAVAFGPVAGHDAAVCQIYNLDAIIEQTGKPDSGALSTLKNRPFRVEALPFRVTAAAVRKSPASVASTQFAQNGTPGLLLGVGGDELSGVRLHLPAGGVFTVLGHPSSGKSSVLRALRTLNPATQWIHPEEAARPDKAWNCLRAAVSSGQMPENPVFLADDADRLPQAALNDLTEIHALGQTIILTASYHPMLLQRLPLAMASRAQGTGLLLAPRSASDGDIFGVRFEIEPGSPAGRAVLISGGRASPLQVAWTPPDDAAACGAADQSAA